MTMIMRSHVTGENSRRNFFAFLLLPFLLTGCVGKFPPHYEAKSNASYNGQLELIRFDYTGAQRKGLSANQVEGIPLSHIYLNIPVQQHVQQAFEEEMQRVGIRNQMGGASVRGSIARLLSDQISLGVNWILEIDYEFYNGQQPIYGVHIRSDKNYSKISNPVDAINELIRDNFDQLMADPQVRSIIETGRAGVRVKPLPRVRY
jgi:hypothetical protein